MWEKEKLLLMSNFSFSQCFQKGRIPRASKGVIVWEWVNRVISDISVVLKEITLTISVSIEADSPIETETVRVVSLSTMEITEFNLFLSFQFFSKTVLTL